jgi:hypothetical protein
MTTDIKVLSSLKILLTHMWIGVSLCGNKKASGVVRMPDAATVNGHKANKRLPVYAARRIG